MTVRQVLINGCLCHYGRWSIKLEQCNEVLFTSFVCLIPRYLYRHHHTLPLYFTWCLSILCTSGRSDIGLGTGWLVVVQCEDHSMLYYCSFYLVYITILLSIAVTNLQILLLLFLPAQVSYSVLRVLLCLPLVITFGTVRRPLGTCSFPYSLYRMLQPVSCQSITEVG